MNQVIYEVTIMKKLVQGKCLLKEVIKSRSMNQTMLAHKSGIDFRIISFYCTGRRDNMTLSVAVCLSDALNCNPRDLYEWEYIEADEIDEIIK
jgi:DNA-binding Xre family transcriptional regulator